MMQGIVPQTMTASNPPHAAAVAGPTANDEDHRPAAALN